MSEQISFEEVIFADLHIHSRFSRACSHNIDFGNLVKWAKIKGLNLLGTGDFTHPAWFNEIKNLKESNGFYYYEDFPFMISGEVSLIYSQNGRGRKVHLVLLVPSIEIAGRIHSYLDNNHLRRDYDGRPIFGISCEKFVKDMKEISEKIEIIPAHIWTPYFGVFGSISGFNSLSEAFGNEINKIYAIETGISSDPEMNWRVKELGDKSILSFSDAHSFWPWRLGREATIFRKTDCYDRIINQIRNNSFVGTIETDPAYGKYHFDGHDFCNFSCSPEESEKINGICPICKKKLTIGVENRVENLSSFPKNFKPQNARFYYKILPLHEIISLAIGSPLESKKVWSVYNYLIELFENEFNILLRVERNKFVQNDVDMKLVDLILKNREGKINVQPGFDGRYGKAIITEKQAKLF